MGSKDQGIGKDSLLAPIELGVGVNNFNSVTAAVALEWSNKGFTAPLLQRLIVRVSEVHDLGKDRFAFYNVIKDWCAAPPTYISVANKNVKPFSILNVVLPFFSTNYLIDGFHIEPGDRRTDLMWSPRTPADFQDEKHRHVWDDYGYDIKRDDEKKDEFWQGYYQHVDRNWQHVVAYLMQPALIERFSPGATPFHSPAWHRVVNAGTDNQDIELRDVLEAIGATMEPWDIDDGIPDAVIIPQITRYPTCPAKLQLFFWNEAPRTVLRRMERAGYLSVESPNRTDGRWRIAGQLYTIYVRREFNRQKALDAARALIDSEEIWQTASRSRPQAASEELQ